MTAYLRPGSIAEAIDARARHPDWMMLAGGTDALVNAPRRPAPEGILDLWRLPGLGGIGTDRKRATLTIGAGSTWLEIQRHPLVCQHVPILAMAAKEIGALQIQARGTLAGNIATSSPVGDSLPVLLALEANVELTSVRGVRELSYLEFCTGYRRTALAADELITAVHVPIPAPGVRLRWRKVGTRRAQSISKVMGAAVIHVDGDIVVRATVAFGAVADRPIRISSVETAVAGVAWSDAADAARTAMAAAISPISDVRSTEDYRLLVAENLVARFFS